MGKAAPWEGCSRNPPGTRGWLLRVPKFVADGGEASALGGRAPVEVLLLSGPPSVFLDPPQDRMVPAQALLADSALPLGLLDHHLLTQIRERRHKAL